MRAAFRKGVAHETSADTLCIGLFEGEQVPERLDGALGGRLAKLVASGEAKPAFKKAALLHSDGAIGPQRVVTVGLGARTKFEAERMRDAAAAAYARSAAAGAQSLAWAVPASLMPWVASAWAVAMSPSCTSTHAPSQR